MIFGWQGFLLEHPDDWAPVSLSGTRREGYARIASPSRLSFQIRWKESDSNVDLQSVLDSYIDRLKSDAQKKKHAFKSDSSHEGDLFTYRYSAEHHGRGAIHYSASCGRVFFIEAISTKNDSLLPTFRKLTLSFSSDNSMDRWSLLGLDLILPSKMEITKKVLQAGRTQLVLNSKAVQIEAQRWGFAEQLVSKHGFEQWCRSVLSLPKAHAEVMNDRISFRLPGNILRPPKYGMAMVQPDLNQITTILVSTRSDEWRPQWTWFA